MDISIIIPVYNASSLLTRCLDSIFYQHTDYTYEVILVDDDSTDNSMELIKARKERCIRLYQQQNAGPAVARKKGWNWHKESTWHSWMPIYGNYFTKDAIGRLMNVAKHSSITWWMLAKFLRYRECHRK